MILPRGALSRGECTQGSPNAPAPFAAVSCGQHPGGSVAGARRQRPTHCPTAARCEDCRGGTSVLRRPDRVASRAPVFLGSSRVSNAGALAETSRHGGPPWVRASADVVLDVSLAAKAAKAFARRGRSELWPANIAAAPSFRFHCGCETCEWCRDSWAWTLMGVDRLRTYEGMIIGIPGISPRPSGVYAPGWARVARATRRQPPWRGRSNPRRCFAALPQSNRCPSGWVLARSVSRRRATQVEVEGRWAACLLWCLGTAALLRELRRLLSRNLRQGPAQGLVRWGTERRGGCGF